MELGEALRRPTSLCMVGCVPGIFLGQPARTTRSVDVWEPESSFDIDDLSHACARVGLRCSPTADLSPQGACLRFFAGDSVALPERIEVQELERSGSLTLTMPRSVSLAVAALAGSTSTDIDDFVFWMTEHRLKLGEVERAIEALARPEQRCAERANLVVAQLTAIDGPGTGRMS